MTAREMALGRNLFFKGVCAAVLDQADGFLTCLIVKGSIVAVGAVAAVAIAEGAETIAI